MKPALLIAVLVLAGCTHVSQVSHSGNGAYEASVASAGQGIAVAWYDDRHGNAEIFLSLYDTTLHPLREEVRLTDSVEQSYEADVVWLNGALAVAWYDFGSDRRSTVHVGLWDRDLNPLWEIAMPGDRNGRIPELVSVNGKLFIAWIEEYDRPGGEGTWSDIRGAWLDATGGFLAAPFFIASASATTWNLNADALADDVVGLVYDAAFETVASELYLARVAGTSAVTHRLTGDDLIASKYPDIAFNGEHAALSWHDEKDGNQEIYLGTFATSLVADNLQPGAIDLESGARRVTDTPGESIGAYLAWHGAELGLAWCDNSAGSHDIFFRTFSAAGAATMPARQLTRTTDDSLIPSIEAAAGGYVIAWNEAHIDGHGTAVNRTTSEVYALLQP